MGVVTKQGQGYANSIANAAVDGLFAEGIVKNVYSQVAVANGDSIGSTHFFARVPSDGRLLPNSILRDSNIASLTSYSVGINQPNGGAVISATCLLNAADIHTAGDSQLGPATGSWNKRFWEIAGLASDPGGYLDIVGTMNAAATGAGTIEVFILFARRGP